MIFEELIIIVLQFVFEFLLNLLIWFPWDILLWWRERRSPPDKRMSDNWLIPLGGILFGGILGGLSLLVVPGALLKNEVARLANIFFTPVLSGAIAMALARQRQRRMTTTDPKLHFWFAFTFSFFLLAIRFAWAIR